MNKSVLLSLIIIILSFGFANGGQLVINGIYQGKNIYVMNPFAADGVGFCVYKVTVNDQITTDDINSSAFEIDLTVFNFKIGEKIQITIEHKDDCKPKILNPEVLKPRSTFKITSMRLDSKTFILKWSTTREHGSLPFYIEQFRWNKWIRIGTVPGLGKIDKNSYTFKVTPNSGLNKFRIRQKDYTGHDNVTRPLNFRSRAPIVTFSPKKPKDNITFSDETLYEIYDMYGVRKLHGYAKKVDVSSLSKGEYFLNLDARTEIIKIR